MFNTAKSSLKWETNHKFTSKQNINEKKSSNQKAQLISVVEVDKKVPLNKQQANTCVQYYSLHSVIDTLQS